MTTRDIAIRGETGIVDRANLLTPAEVVETATVQAKLLMDIVEKTKCYQQIRDKKYLQVEAWETIGAFNRTHAETADVQPIIVDGQVTGYQARVQLWKDGHVVGGATMPAYFTENCCKGKEGDAKHKAAMSAAQTFATSKAYRMNLSYVAILAGYQPLPAEEVTEDMKDDAAQAEGHWCETHKTAFFKRGKMRSFAHPIGDTGEWCHEPSKPAHTTASPSPSTGGAALTDAQAPTPAGGTSLPAGGQPGTPDTGQESPLRASKVVRDSNAVVWGEVAAECIAIIAKGKGITDSAASRQMTPFFRGAGVGKWGDFGSRDKAVAAAKQYAAQKEG